MCLILRQAKVFLVIFCCLFFFGGVTFSQDGETDEGKSDDIQDIGLVLKQSVKKAIEEIDTQKAIERQKEQEGVNSALDKFMGSWLDTKNLQRKSRLKSLIQQNWQDLLSTPPEHQDYYLRDFSYDISSRDIVAQDSLTYPYIAAVRVREVLYAERAPLIAQPRQDYEYTVEITLLLTLIYDKADEAWRVADSETANIDLRQGWPARVQSKVGTFFIPKE